MTELRFAQRDDTSVAVTFGGADAGVLRVRIIRPGNDAVNYPWPADVTAVESSEAGARLTLYNGCEDVTATLALERHEAGLVGTLSAAGRAHACVRVSWTLPRGVSGFPLIPAFMYGHNEGGAHPTAMYPQLSRTDNTPVRPWRSNEWLVRTDRSSHGVSSVIFDDVVFAIGGRDVCRFADGSVAEKTGLGTTLRKDDGGHEISFSLGFINRPYTYSPTAARNYFGRPEGFPLLERGEVSADFFMLAFPHPGRQKAAARLLRETYALMHDDVPDAGTIREGADAISSALVEHAWCPEAHNFYTTLVPDPRQMAKRRDFTNGWSGGTRTAYPLLVAGLQLDNARYADVAREVLTTIAEHGISAQSGLFNDAYHLDEKKWDAKGWWYAALDTKGHSGYVSGQICHYLLLGYLAEKAAGHDRAGWLAAARKVLDKAADEQADNGCFGYVYDENTGAIIDGDGFSSCWFVPAFANLFRITGDKRYLDVATRAMDFYRADVDAFHVYGGPHDIYKSPDEEGILAFIDGAAELHEITGDPRWLDDLVKGLDYEFSWKFAYNVVHEHEPLRSMDWGSTGGSVTSVNNSHIHPMGSAIARSMLYAAEVTDDPYIRSRLRDTVRWTLTIYLHHDGHFGWGKRGMICERFCYTDALLAERFPDGSPSNVWFAAHSWASGAALEGLVGPILEKNPI